MIQVFQYPHDTLMQVSSSWNKNDSIEGYNDIEKFEFQNLAPLIPIEFDFGTSKFEFSALDLV